MYVGVEAWGGVGIVIGCRVVMGCVWGGFCDYWVARLLRLVVFLLACLSVTMTCDGAWYLKTRFRVGRRLTCRGLKFVLAMAMCSGLGG